MRDAIQDSIGWEMSSRLVAVIFQNNSTTGTANYIRYCFVTICCDMAVVAKSHLNRQSAVGPNASRVNGKKEFTHE